MALDKIFIHRKDLSYSEVKESDSDITFIQKATLLGLIKEKQDVLDLHDEYEAGRYDALQEISDKISEL